MSKNGSWSRAAALSRGVSDMGQGILHVSTITPVGTDSCLQALLYFARTAELSYSLPHLRVGFTIRSIFSLLRITLYTLLLGKYAIINRNLLIPPTSFQYYPHSFLALGLRFAACPLETKPISNPVFSQHLVTF